MGNHQQIFGESDLPEPEYIPARTPKIAPQQTSIPLSKEPKAPARIRGRLLHADNRHSKIQVWLNGDLITGEHSLVVRNSDILYLLSRLSPEILIVDRENVSDDLWKRIKHLPEVELI